MSARPHQKEHAAGLQSHPLPATCASPASVSPHEEGRRKPTLGIVPLSPTVVLRRAADITDQQAAAALHTSYGIILNAARRVQAAEHEGERGGAA